MKKFLMISMLANVSFLFAAGETLVVKALGDTDGDGVQEYSMNKVSSDGEVTLLLEFESEYGTCAGCSFVNEYEGKFYLGGANGFAIYDIATNTVSYQANVDGSLLTRQMLWNGDEVVSKSNDDVTIGSTDLKASDGTTLISNSTDTDGDAITVIGSNEVVGANGNTLISEEENGEIHIGENSLVTVEKDGVQLLYATDANGDQIDINIKKGTDLLVDGKSVTQALKDIDTNKTNISKNATDIATNKTNIAKNTDDIATNKTNIAKNADDIATNKTNIAKNADDIATNKTNIATNSTNIATNKTNIATNATNIATNATNIATNKSNIEINALGIANNSARIDNLAALVNSNMNRIEGLETLTGLMRNEYRTGIASSIALSQIQYASDGFSIGVGHGEFKDKDEMAVGIGYGGQFNEKVGYQFQFGSSGDSTGFGFTIRF